MKSVLIKLGTVAAMGLLVFAAACGGDDDDEGGDSTPASQATSASTAAATVAGDPTPASDDGGGSSEQPQFSDLSADSQTGVNTICLIAADPTTGLSQAVDLDAALQAAKTGEYGPEIAEAAGPLSDALVGTDPDGFDAAIAGMKAVCDDIGWTAP